MLPPKPYGKQRSDEPPIDESNVVLERGKGIHCGVRKVSETGVWILNGR